MTEKELKERTKASLLGEAGELTAIMVASRKTMLARNRESKIQNRK